MFAFAVYDKATARYVAVQIVNPPDFSAFDLPRCLNLVKEKADAPVVAIEVYYKDNHVCTIKYLAKKEM